MDTHINLPMFERVMFNEVSVAPLCPELLVVTVEGLVDFGISAMAGSIGVLQISQD